MRWKLVGLSILLAITAWLWVILLLNLLLGNSRSAYAFTINVSSSTLSTSSIPSTPTPVTKLQNSSESGTAIPAAWIGFAGLVLAALIGSLGAAFYQSRRNAQIEKEKRAAQLELERERIRFQDEIHAARVAQEREKQRKEMDNIAALAAMNRAQNIVERDQAYRDSLRADPRIARLQILDMSHPLDVANVFVRVRLHQETKPSYELDPTLLAAEAQRDPNELLRVSRLHLEHRTSSALDPEEAIRMPYRLLCSDELLIDLQSEACLMPQLL